MKRIDAEKLLLMEGNVTGTFLVKESESQPGNYALSIKYNDVVKHYSIKKVDTEGFYISIRQKFTTLDQLVQYYSKSADGLCTNLTVQCPKIFGLSSNTKDEWEVEHRSIEVKCRIVNREFSEIWEGIWNGTTPVTVITPKPGSTTVSDFLAEAQIMKKLRHNRLVQLYAVCTPFYIVTELMKHGSLSDYLSKGEGQHLTFQKLIDIAAQITDGMAYLESQHCVHRDLRALNVLVEEGNIVKIGNFSLARFLIDGECSIRKEERFAIKWTAPEAVLYERFTIKSDVWSYGVFLTEVVTYGRKPYPGMTNDEVVARVEQGYRMPPPPECPDPLYQIMLECWKTDPEERPTFEYLKYQLEDYFVSTAEEAYHVHMAADK